nr:Imm50 family immunity protein [Prosthecomicrobium pneumaticum]
MLEAEFIKILYGEELPFDRIFITEVILRPHGPEIFLKFNVSRLPIDIPKKWGRINRVSINMSFLGIRSLSLAKLSYPRESSLLGSVPDDGGVIRISIRGEIELDFECEFVSVKGVGGYWYSDESY